MAAMKHHKAEDPAHDYCSKCDVDCDDWDDLIRHKVRAMEPWLATPRPAGSPRHIVCEFCGEDLKSLRGRETHRREVRIFRARPSRPRVTNGASRNTSPTRTSCARRAAGCSSTGVSCSTTSNLMPVSTCRWRSSRSGGRLRTCGRNV